MRYGREIWTSIVAATVGFFLFFTFALCVPGYRVAKKRAGQRACFANQKTLMGATEMYNLDFNTQVEVLDRDFLETLRDQGYLQAIPEDPDNGEGSWRNYFMVTQDPAPDHSWSHFEIMCLHHGFIQPPAGTSLADGGMGQLRALGIDPGRAPQRHLPISWLSRKNYEALEQGLSGLLEAGMVIAGFAALLVFPVALIRLLVYSIAEVVAYWTHGPLRPEPPAPALAKVDLASARCPVCADGFGAGTPMASMCPSCQTPHHEPCLRYIGHCAVFACSRTELTERRRQQAVAEKERTATG